MARYWRPSDAPGPRTRRVGVYETKRRSVVKALSWRFIATLITAGVVYIFTGEASAAVEIGLLDTTVKLGAYFAHERIWLRVPFGRPPPSDYQI